MRSKFYNIKYPIFTLKDSPVDEIFRDKKLFIKKDFISSDSLLLVDSWDNMSDNNYLKRLEYLNSVNNYTIKYDYTCTNLSALLLSKSKWGYDSNLNTHYFDNYYKHYKMSYRKIIKVKETAFWVEDISHPFELPKFLLNIENLKNLWAGLVYIDFCWHIYEFSAFYNKKDRIRL
tara:strand:+ start:2615 stop:3139 length:525 start_codon:yes stop_codon:yes gene_type:complete